VCSAVSNIRDRQHHECMTRLADMIRAAAAAWSQRAKLTASDGAADDKFGYPSPTPPTVVPR